MLIDGHIIDETILNEGDWILDAGCRHFVLEKELNKYNFVCLDPDIHIIPYQYPFAGYYNSLYRINFEHKALMSYSGKAKYCGWSTGEGNIIYQENAPDYATEKYEVDCVSIRHIMDKYNINQFSLAKIDIEGSEYDLLLSIDSPFTKQIAIEFHQSLGYNKYGSHDDYINKLMSSPFGEIYKIGDHYEYDHCKGLYEYQFILI